MALLTLRDLSLHYGTTALLDKVNLVVEPGERIALVGRNGTGKSTLFKVIANEVQVDEGEVQIGGGGRMARLAQEAVSDQQGTVYEVIAQGEAELAGLLSRYHAISEQMMHDCTDAAMAELEQVQHQLEQKDGWLLSQRIDEVISRLSLPAETQFQQLSGGMRRRVLLGQALVQQPDILMLDEPTNHLDLDSIDWLEEFFLSWGGTLLFITHDRTFLQKLATRIIELDRGNLTSWPGDYPTYLRRKAEALESEQQQNALFDKRLAEEERWIRQGVKARRTRNEGRVRALESLRKERSERRERTGNARLQIDDRQRSGKLVMEAKGVSYAYGEHPMVTALNTTIMRGDRVGLIGPNGVGKTTLLRLLLGELTPQQGEVRIGTQLEIAYFDQHRSQLDDNHSVFDAVAGGRSEVTIGGASRHVMSYLQDFLFTPDRVRSPVSSLSGGERNRLLLARLFATPSNLLVMDEPTNDLDIETLELLEELLLEYKGTLLLVSHDRSFLDHVVTSTLVFEGNGVINEYVGGYEDWKRQQAAELKQMAAAKPVSPSPVTTNKPNKATAAKSPTKKLSYKDQRVLELLPAQIEALDGESEQLTQQMSEPDFFRQSPQKIAKVQDRLAAIAAELKQLYQRWEELEG